MWIKYHEEITRKALENHFPPSSLWDIIQSNIKQDGLLGQIGHSHFHFDNNTFNESYAYIQDQREQLLSCLEKNQQVVARKHFGRVLHSFQDFYAHSNYVTLWLKKHDPKLLSHHDDIDPCDDQLLESSKLRSGRLYYPLEILSFIPVLKEIVLPLLPSDSHARMNLDGPESGKKFPYAFSAAVKRTINEFEGIISGMPADHLALFLGE